MALCEVLRLQRATSIATTVLHSPSRYAIVFMECLFSESKSTLINVGDTQRLWEMSFADVAQQASGLNGKCDDRAIYKLLRLRIDANGRRKRRCLFVPKSKQQKLVSMPPL